MDYLETALTGLGRRQRAGGGRQTSSVVSPWWVQFQRHVCSRILAACGYHAEGIYIHEFAPHWAKQSTSCDIAESSNINPINW
jgi:hypothetical protein